MYAPVSIFAMQMAGDHLIGYAAPLRGAAPCLIELTADDVPIAVARATRFSPAARAKSIRLGWCGVKVPGLAIASAIGSDLRVRCGVSGRSLWSIKANAPISGRSREPKPLTVFEIIALSRGEDGASGLEELYPILRQHLRRLGAASFINATYETFLGRPAEPGAMGSLGDKKDDRSMDGFLESVFKSNEYRSQKSFNILPGPFSFSFKYDLDALDNNT